MNKKTHFKILSIFLTVFLLGGFSNFMPQEAFATLDIWNTQKIGTINNTLYDVFFVDASNGWAVGQGGVIFVTTDGGTTWSTQTGTGNHLSGVSFVDENNGWAVGVGGTILVYNGTTWDTQDSGTGNALSAVSFVDENNGWAVGQDGIILVYNGTNWKTQTSGPGNNLNDVFFVDENNGWAVGNGGTILVTKDGGTNWSPPTNGTSNILFAVSFVDESKGWAVGFGGAILVTDDGGDNWSTQTNGVPSNTLNDVFFVDENKGWAVGQGGIILVTINGGENWSTQTSGTNNILTAVSFVDANNGWAVGLDEIILAGSETIPKTSNKGSCADCTPPTFGKDKNYRQIVQGGFSFNGNVTDVTDYWTPYHTITAQTNSTHNFTLKAYENQGVNNIKWFQFGVVPEVGTPLNDAEVLATIYMQSSEIEEIVERDPNNLWDIVNATSYIESCGYVDSDCLEISLDVVFRDELKNKVIVIQAMDNSRNADTMFLNEGIDVVGESINEPLISYVTVSKGGAFYPQDRGVVELTLTSYKDNAWQDEYGYMWTSDNNKSFQIVDSVPVPIKEPDVMWQAMTRINSNFADMIIFEQNRALLVYPPEEAFADMKEPFAYELPKSEEEQQKELQKRIDSEAHRAQKELDEMFAKWYHHK